MSLENPEARPIEYAARLIHRGEVVAIPTDTFYGLAADPFNLAAVDRIYTLKGRPEQRALPVLVNSIDQAQELAAYLPETFYRLTEKFWPGALTLVVDAAAGIPLKVTGNTGRIALRLPGSKISRAVIVAVGAPVTGTSANISGFAPCSSGEQVQKQLGEQLPLILNAGDTRAKLPSTVAELRHEEWRILREGVIREEQIRAALAR
ncbi:MAG: L-threonylcarbamoyladenylate synthase [Terriglobia bacterium]